MPGPGSTSPGRTAPLRTAVRLSLGIAVSVTCLYFATRGTHWGEVGAVLASASPSWVGALMLACFAALYVRAQRWRVLLRPLGKVSLYPALSATAIGFGASAVLPFRVGELVRPALLGRRVGFGMSATLSSIVLERLFDMLLVIVCLLIVSLAYPVPEALRRGAFFLSAFALLALAALVAVQRRPERAEALIERLLGALPARVRAALLPMARAFLSGLRGLADASTIALVFGYSVYLWTVITLTFMLGFLALGTDVPLLAASLTTVVVVAAFVFLPQAPGFVGTWQAGCVVALGFFDVPKDVAVGYSLLTWLVSMVMNVGAAGVFLAREDLSLGQLLRSPGTPPHGGGGVTDAA